MSYDTTSPKQGIPIEPGAALSTLVFDPERELGADEPEHEPVRVDPAPDTEPELPETD